MAAAEAILRTFIGEKSYAIYPVKGSTKIWGGSRIGLDGSGYAIKLAIGGTYGGIAEETADNSGGSDGDISVRVVVDARVEQDVTGVDGPDDVTKTVYAGDDEQVDIADAGTDVAVGKIVQHISGTKCIVRETAVAMRSL